MSARPSAWAKLLRTPRRFRFDAAQRVLMHAARTADPAQAARFRSAAGLAYAPGEVLSVAAPAAGQPPQVTVGLVGLLGPSGTLPRLYGESAAAASRGRSAALHDFLDLLAQRMVGCYARAGVKYRLHRAAEAAGLTTPPRRDPVSSALLALTGHGTPGMAERLAAGEDALLHYAGLFAMRPRSADRLAALVSDWLGHPVTVEQFAGRWLDLPADQRTALPLGQGGGAWNRLGVDAAIGARSWDLGRIVLRVGPLDAATFASLLPDQPAYARLTSLVRTFLGPETDFAVNPVLAAPEVPALRLLPADGGGARLGWNAWLEPPASPRQREAAEARFAA